jgi:hypothetical protein
MPIIDRSRDKVGAELDAKGIPGSEVVKYIRERIAYDIVSPRATAIGSMCGLGNRITIPQECLSGSNSQKIRDRIPL